MSVADFLLLSWIETGRNFLCGSVIEESWRSGDIQVIEMTEDDTPCLSVARGYTTIDHLPSIAVITGEYSSTNDILIAIQEIIDQDMPIHIIIATDNSTPFRQKLAGLITIYTMDSLRAMKYHDSGPAILFLSREDLSGDMPSESSSSSSSSTIAATVLDCGQFNAFVSCARRPVIVLGAGVRPEHMPMILCFRMPVVVVPETLDRIEGSSRFFMGRAGMDGDRVGNFTLQNADLILFLGTVHFRTHPWLAREAHSLSIPTRHITSFFSQVAFRPSDEHMTRWQSWFDTCRRWRGRWLAEMPSTNDENSSLLHPYLFHGFFQSYVSSLSKTIIGKIDDSWWYPLYQQVIIQEGDHFLTISSRDTIPIAIGAASAISDEQHKMIVFVGDTSIFRFQDLTMLYENGTRLMIVCMNPSSSDMILCMDDNGYLTRTTEDNQDEIYTLAEVSEISGLGAEVRHVYSYEDIMDIFNENVSTTMFIEIHVTNDFVPTPKGRLDKPLENMEPMLHKNEMEMEMIIQPIMLE